MAARLLCANWRCNYLQHPNVAEFSGFCCRKCHEWSKNPRRKQHHGRLCQQETPEGPVSRAVADVALRAAPEPFQVQAPATVDVTESRWVTDHMEPEMALLSYYQDGRLQVVPWSCL